MGRYVNAWGDWVIFFRCKAEKVSTLGENATQGVSTQDRLYIIYNNNSYTVRDPYSCIFQIVYAEIHFWDFLEG